MNFWNRLRAIKMFFQLVKNPNRTDLIFKGVAIASEDVNQELVKTIEQLVLSDKPFQVMYTENYIPDLPQLKILAGLPEQSFGKALYKHMNDNNLDFKMFFNQNLNLDLKRPIYYLSTRIYQDHDLWHVLLGYGTDVEDELAIQAFGVAQFHSPIGVVIIAGGLLHLLGKNPARAVDAFRKINEAYQLGRKTKFLLSVRIHELLPRPLNEVRQMCGLTG